MTECNAAFAAGGKARLAGDVPRDQERAALSPGQFAFHRLGTFGETEGKRGPVAKSGDRRASNQFALGGILLADTECSEIE